MGIHKETTEKFWLPQILKVLLTLADKQKPRKDFHYVINTASLDIAHDVDAMCSALSFYGLAAFEADDKDVGDTMKEEPSWVPTYRIYNFVQYKYGGVLLNSGVAYVQERLIGTMKGSWYPLLRDVLDNRGSTVPMYSEESKLCIHR